MRRGGRGGVEVGGLGVDLHNADGDVEEGWTVVLWLGCYLYIVTIPE